MSYALGVDLGTTFTAAATANGAGPTMIGLGNRALQVPSVLFLDADQFLVGESAERRGAVEPDRLAREFKRRLGDHVPLLVGGAPFSAELLTARLLSWVITTTSERMGEPPESVVLTHPANWGPFKMEVFRQVSTLADVRNVSWIPEPVAAAAQYASRARVEVGEKLAIYDLGGGTFDVCIVEKTDDGFRMLGNPDGVEHLGGTDLDHALFERVMASLSDRLQDLDPDDPELAVGLSRLRRDCVDAKEALSSDVTAVIPVALPGLSTSVRITRSEFEELIRPSLLETLAATRRGLSSADIQPSELAGVVLIGGSSRIPLVGEMLQHEFGVPAALDTHPKHDVALGAVRLSTHDHAAGSPTAAASAIAPPKQADSTSLSEQPSIPPKPAPPPEQPPASQPEAPVGNGPTPAGTRPSRRRALIGAAAGVAAAVAITAIVVRSQNDREETGSGQPTQSVTSAPATPPTAVTWTVPQAATPLPNNTLLWPREVRANWDIWTITVSGVDSRRVTLGDGPNTRPVLSGDRKSFIYHHEAALGSASDPAGDVTGLRIAAIDGSGDRPLFPEGPSASVNLGRPGWSPDGTMIAAASRTAGQPTKLMVLTLDGSSQRTIAEAPKLDDPTFTPDGKNVTYWASEPTDLNGGTLMTVPVDGSEEPRVLIPGKAGQDADPAWSPDGSTLTFRRRGAGGHDIWIANRDGGGLKQLTDAPGDDQDPSWSPDGRRIAFKSARNGEPDIFVMNADGSNQHLVLHNPEADDAPAWTRR